MVTDHSKEIPDEWKEIANDYAGRLQSWPQFADLPFDEQSSCILQSICQSLRNCHEVKSLKKLIKDILEKSFSIEDEIVKIEEIEEKEGEENEEEKNEEKEETLKNMPKIFNSNSTLHLLEAMIMSAGEKYLLKMYNKFFKVIIGLADLKIISSSV